MPLRLQIISDQRRLLGEQSAAVFGPEGGRIGRAPDNDWVLPDPRRYLSAHHATIIRQGDGYAVVDTSTNGVFANESRQAIGRNKQHPLRSGDTLRIGDYRFLVAIEPTGVHGGLTPADDTGTGLSAGASRNSAIFDVHAGLNAFCSGAGIDADQLQPGSDLRVLLLAGRLLRESLRGLRDLAALAPGDEPEDPPESPALQLIRLLNGQEAGDFDATEVLREEFAQALKAVRDELVRRDRAR